MGSKAHILSTALLDQLLMSKVTDTGMQLDAMPFIHTEDAIGEGDTLEQVERLYRKPLTVVFTSVNAVRAVCDQVYFTGEYWNVYCIGHATRNEVLKYFNIAHIKGLANDAAALAGLIKQNGVPGVVFFCGDKRMETLSTLLQKAGVHVKEVTVYRTVEVPKYVDKDHDGILFFSPSAVNSFFSMNTITEGTVLFAIGETTAKAIKEYTDNAIVVSELPSKEHLVDKAIQYFSKRAMA